MAYLWLVKRSLGIDIRFFRNTRCFRDFRTTRSLSLLLCYLVGQSLRAWIKWLAICIFSTLSYHVGTSITLKRHKKVAPTDALFQTMILHYSSLATWMADNIIKKCLHNWTNKLFLKHRWWRKWALCKKMDHEKAVKWM